MKKLKVSDKAYEILLKLVEEALQSDEVKPFSKEDKELLLLQEELRNLK